MRGSKTGWVIVIWLVFALDQCFLNFGEGFRDSWFHLSGRSSICESFSEFVAVHAKEVRTLCFNGIHQYFAPISAFWILVRVFEKNGFTCPDEVLFVKVAQSLLQNLSKKRKHVVVLESLRYFALISVFCILVQNFRKITECLCSQLIWVKNSIFSDSRSPLCSDWNRSYEITLRPNVRFGSGLSGFPVFGRRFHRKDLHCVRDKEIS